MCDLGSTVFICQNRERGITFLRGNLGGRGVHLDSGVPFPQTWQLTPRNFAGG